MSDPKPYADAKKEWVRSYFIDILRYAKGRTGGAARVAGMTIPNFCKYLRQLGLSAKDYR